MIHDALAQLIEVNKYPEPVDTTETMRLPLLYTYRRCPYAMRARMALLVAEREFTAVEIMLRNKPAAMLVLSPKGTVPVLQLPDGSVLDESWDIMCWALEDAADASWWQAGQTPENLDLLARNDVEFKRHLDRYKYPERHGLVLADRAAVRDSARDAAVAVLLVQLDARLLSQPYLGGATPCATDLAIFPFVRQFAAMDPRWFEAQKLLALQAWLAAWLSGDLVAACMVKHTAQTRL